MLLDNLLIETKKEMAIRNYNYFYNMNELTKEMYGHENRIALAGMKKNEWAIK